MRHILVILVTLSLALTPPMGWAGQGGNSTPEGAGTFPPGSYTYPPNFSTGRQPGAGFRVFGMRLTTDQLTNPDTLVEMVVEVSYDGGQSWPQACVNASACRCHDASQDATRPSNADWCAQTLRGANWPDPIHMQCSFARVTDTNTRTRGRLNVCGAPATGGISSTWR